jgi:hypothetical protein
MPVNRAATAKRASRFAARNSRRAAGEVHSRFRYAPHAVVRSLAETARQDSRRQHQPLFVVYDIQYRQSCRPAAMHSASSVNCGQPVKNSRRVAGEPFHRSDTRITPIPSRRLLTSASKRHAGASCAIFDSRCSVSTVMSAVNQYTPLRFPRPCARSGGATLCSMYCLTAGQEITSGGWRSLFPDPIRTHRLFCHAACRNSRASAAPGRRVLLVLLDVSCPQPCRTTAPQQLEERHGSPG